MTAGVLVDLPPFPDSDKPVTVKLRKPSILSLVQSGKIPNELLQTLMESNERGLPVTGKGTDWNFTMSIMRVLCQACMVEPKYEQLQAEGIELTDEQIHVITAFAQGGVKALKPFRQQSGDNQDSPNSVQVSETP